MRILVVEDSDDNRDTLKVALEMQGHTVATATNGMEALYSASLSTPDVILMDIGMPIMDGLKTAQAFRARPETRASKMFAVSAYVGQSEWRDKALAAGFDGCLSKPLDFDALAGILAT